MPLKDPKSKRRGLWLLLGGALLTSCAPFSVNIQSCPERKAQGTDKVTVQYLGVGGFLIFRGEPQKGVSILTAPLYSNPSLLEVAGDHAVRPDAELIDRLLPEAARFAKAILVGHAHFDHLMDVPYIALHHATNANVYGSETTAHLLATTAKAMKAQGTSVVPLAEGEIWDELHDGRWTTVTPGIRVAAIRSEHSPQVALKFGRQRIPFHLWRGRVDEDLERLPRSVSEWPEGTVLAYLIDFLDGDEIKFRIYYQDSGTNEPIGFVPERLKGGRNADLTIICVGGNFRQLIHHPEGILRNTRPRFVLLAHWEDFFQTQDGYCERGGHYGPKGLASPPYCTKGRIYGLPALSFLEGTDTREFLDHMKHVVSGLTPRPKYWLPCPTRSVFEFEVQ